MLLLFPIKLVKLKIVNDIVTSCRGVKTVASMLFELVSEYKVSDGWVDSGTHESHREDTTVYPSSGQFGPYVQQLMILILKSTQNREVTIECREREVW